MPKGQVLAINVRNLVAELEKVAQPKTPEERTLRLYIIRQRRDGSYALVDRGSHTGPVIYETSETKRPGRFGKTEHPGPIVDALVLGEPSTANDAQCWQAALAVAEQEGLKADDLRQFADSIARALIVRAGLAAVRPDHLPQDFEPEPPILPEEPDAADSDHTKEEN